MAIVVSSLAEISRLTSYYCVVLGYMEGIRFNLSLSMANEAGELKPEYSWLADGASSTSLLLCIIRS